MFKNLMTELGKEWAFRLWIIIFATTVTFCLSASEGAHWGGYHWRFWNYWEIGALVSTGAYNSIFYVLGFFLPPYMFVRGSLKNDKMLGLVLPIMAVSIVTLGYATYLSLNEGSCRFQLGLIVAGVCSFLCLDYIMMRQSKDSKVAEDFHESVKFNDWPSLVAFGALLIFSLIYQPSPQAEADKSKLDLVRAFIGGAIAFQMIASNWALAFIFRRPGDAAVTQTGSASPTSVTSKVVFAILLLACVSGAWWLARRTSRDEDTHHASQGLLGRPLRVSVVSWPGYAGGILANNGFKPTKDCLFWKKHNLLVELVLLEDVDARAKAFARGGVGGIDIMYSTVDFWANEGVGFSNNGVDARAIMQVDWSRGGDAIVVDKSINRIEDLKDKNISLALFTPSHWLLEYSLETSSLSEAEQDRVVKSLIGKNASTEARTDFVAGKVDAAVVWEPDVAEALQKRAGSHVLVSTREHPNLIADIMIAKQDFLTQHADVIRAFIRGWFDGTEEANRKHDLVVDLLMRNEPLYRDLGESVTRDGLSTVKWADLSDNTKMFGLDGGEVIFDRIFAQAGRAWIRRGYIKQQLRPAQARDDRFIRELQQSASTAAQQETPK